MWGAFAGEILYILLVLGGGLVNLSRGIALGDAATAALAAADGGDGGGDDDEDDAAYRDAVIDAHRGFRLRVGALLLINCAVWFAVGAAEGAAKSVVSTFGSLVAICSGCLAMRWKTRLPAAKPLVTTPALAAATPGDAAVNDRRRARGRRRLDYAAGDAPLRNPARARAIHGERPMEA